jgi:hypothetical protein
VCDSHPKNLQLAYSLARETLSGMDITQQCLRSGAQYVHPDKVTIEYLNQSYIMAVPGMEISLGDSPGHREEQESHQQIDLRDRILMLHYLIAARGTPATGKLIGFRQLPGGIFEHIGFSREILAPLLDHFGREPERLLEAAANMGGARAAYGDVAVSIKAFPNVPVVIVLWRGDDEFAPNASMLFDSTVTDYLSTEDLSVLCARIVEKLTLSEQSTG